MQKRPLLSGMVWRVVGGIAIVLLMMVIVYTLMVLVTVLNEGIVI